MISGLSLYKMISGGPEHAVVAVRYEQKWLILDNLTMAIITAEDQLAAIIRC